MATHGEYGEYEEESVAGEYPDSSKTVSGGGASEDDAAASPPTPPSAGAANGDARLRNAVAAWVATAAEGGEGESGSPAGGDVSAEASDTVGEGAADAVDRASGEGVAEPGSGDAPKSDTATAVFRTDRPRVETSGDGGADAGEPPADKATAVFKTVPSWAKKDEAEDAAAATEPGDAKPGEGKAAAADPRTSRDAESGEARSGEADKSGAAEPGTAKPDAAGSGDAKAGGARSGDAKAGGAKSGVSQPEGGRPEGGRPEGAEPEGSKSGVSQPEGGKPEGGRPEGGRPESTRPEGGRPEGSKPGVSKPEGGKPEGGRPEGSKPGDSKPEGGKPEGGEPVDQATAVFKAVKPTGTGTRGVDQPTTMLKLGDAKPKPKPESESESERTSKFVALKPLDEPRAAPERKAPPQGEPKAPAAPAPAQEAAPAPAERTTQQPLPPKPPLDLLAELTNTPPPPETPARTLVRRFKIWTPLVLLLAIVFAVVQAVRPLPDGKLSMTAKETFSFGGGKPSIPWPADGQAAMDVDGIGTFGTSGKPKPVPIASIAKVMTTYLILRDHPIKKGTEGKTLTVDAQAQRHYEKGKPENESVVKVTEGQKISQYEALQAVMLPSANNVARMLARWDSGGDEKKFVAKMNETAKELGMKNTHYTDPSGLDKTTVSTAEDLVKLGRVAMENQTFKEIARQPKYEDVNGDEQKNYFGLVPTVAIGIKTGTTTAAGGNILFAAEKKVGGKTQVIIGAALAQFGKPGVANIDQVTNVVKDLISGGQDALTAKTVVKKGTVVGHVDDGLGGETPVVTTKDVTAVGWSGLTAKLELTDGGKKVPHTAKKGTKVGVLSVGDGTDGAIKVPVALAKDLAEPGLGAKLTRIG
ncbi:D-alanyl-D-alanine carboxypeptidase [Streptomyces sp. NPDC053474]|uniref:D-alanyl-D-alanine carboxypeptidase n=1 Tax=Streptomyces sp. NPDC053474 TaxID=3365704 RepID=UPI0037D433B7